MTGNKSSYRNIVKGTAVFGGVQVFSILINLLRGKFIALFLGPVGMGVSGMLMSYVNTISQFSGMGLNLSAVRDISQANEDGDLQSLSRIAKIFRILVLGSGIIGALICIVAAPKLSSWAFGNSDYTIAFVILSVMVLFSALTNGETALLQGTRRIKDLARASLAGSFSGLVVGVPLYYLFGIKAIAPAMVLFSLITYLVNRYYARKIYILPIEVTRKDVVTQGKGMVILGLTLMVATLLGTLSTQIVYTYIARIGNITDVGLFQSSTSVTNQYVGLVFTAMAVDYFPRLASVVGDRGKVRRTVNSQLEIVTLVVVPLLIALIITAPLVVRILFTKEFLAVIPLLRWMAIGLFFKALSFPIGYISFAKGDKKTFFLLEGVFGNALTLTGNIIGYKLFGLLGLGFSFVACYLIYFIIIIIVTRIRYGFHLRKSSTILLIPSAILSISTFTLLIMFNSLTAYVLCCLLFLLSSWYSYRELDKRIGIKEIFISRFKKVSNE